MSLPAALGPLALFACIFLGEAGLPLFVPAELALVASGAAVGTSWTSVEFACVALVADVLGALVLFCVVRRGATLAARIPRLARLFSAVERAAARSGARSARRVACARCIPLLRVPAAFGAGISRLSLPSFAAAASIGSIVWVSVFLATGIALAGELSVLR